MQLKINGNMFISVDGNMLKCNIEKVEENQFVEKVFKMLRKERKLV